MGGKVGELGMANRRGSVKQDGLRMVQAHVTTAEDSPACV